MPDYIPASDANFHAWHTNFINKVFAYAATLGLVPSDYGPATAKQSVWNAAYPAHLVSELAAKNNRQSKLTARLELTPELRSLVQHCLTSNAMTNTIRSDMGLPLENDGGSGGAPPPIGQPDITRIDTNHLLKHEVHWRDAANPTKRAKPDGVAGARVYMKIDGAAPVSTDDMTFVAVDDESPYLRQFAPEHVGKRVYWALKWTTDLGGDGEDGPQSEIFSAIVTG